MKLVFAAAVITGFTEAVSDRCYALSLEGGGAKGAYEAGVVWGLMHYGNPDDFQWQVVSGISAGAVNTGAMSVWSPSQGLEMSEWVSDQWSNLKTSNIWQFWDQTPPLYGLEHAIFNEGGVVNDQPLFDYMVNTLADFDNYGEGRRSVVAATSFNSGEYVVMSTEMLPFDEWAQAVVSSASIPGVFPPQHFMNDILSDGGCGTTWGLKPEISVQECLNLGYSLDQITVDIVMEEGVVIDTLDEDDFPALGHYMRGRQISKYNAGMANVFESMRAYPQVDWRYLIQPSGHMPNGINLLRFGNESTWFMQEMGREDAKNALKMANGEGFIKLSEWQESENKKGAFSSFADYLWSIVL